MVLNTSAIVDLIKADAQIFEQFQKLSGMCKFCRITLLFTQIDNAAVTIVSNPILKSIRDCGNLMIFENMADIKFINVPMAAVRAVKKQAAVGDACYITATSIMRIKVPLL